MRVTSFALVLLFCCASACSRADRIPTGFNADEVPAAEPLDPGINPEDSWIVFDAAMTTIDTVDLTEPILDAETGQTVSQLVLTSGPDTLYSVEAGYDFDGILRLRMTGQWPAGDPTVQDLNGETVLLVSQGTLYAYDAGGSLMPVPQTPDSASGVDPLGILGNDLRYGSVTEGVLTDSLRPGASLVHMDAGSGSGDTPAGTVSRRHERRRGRDALKEIRHYVVSSSGGVRHSSTVLITLEGLNWHENRVRDQWRARRRGEGPESGGTGRKAGSSGQTGNVLGTPTTANMEQLPCEEIDCEEPPPPPPPPPPLPPPTTLIWQHGLFSSGGIWNRMRGWVEPQFNDYPVVESLNSTDRVENQATDLIARLEARARPAGVVIGHSQGGLVGRRVAQRRPDLVRGVLTVGTPHRGAILAYRTRAVIRSGLHALTDALWLDCTGPDMDWGCAVAWLIRNLTENALVAYAADAAVPASADLLPQD